MLLYLIFEIFHLFFPYMSLHSKIMGIITANCYRIMRAKRARSADVGSNLSCHDFLNQR